MPPSTQQSRPFFSNFLAAFRSSQLSSTPIISNSSSSHQKSTHTHPHPHSQTTPSQPRQISTSTSTNTNTSTKSNATSTALRGLDRNRSSNAGSSPLGSYDSNPHLGLGASNFLNSNPNAQPSNPSTPPQTSNSPPNPHPNKYNTKNAMNNINAPKLPSSPSAHRRGSDSSSEGFRDVLGVEKWYIGGRTQMGEERYFQLGVVRRRRSGGELSLDRLSL